MFIEPHRQAHGQAKQEPHQARPKIIVTKEGNFHYLFGGFMLMASFFMPAALLPEKALYPFHSLFAAHISIKFLPVLYVLGLSTSLLIGAGRFRNNGIPNHLLITHMLLSSTIILGTGIILHGALIQTSNRFGLTMMPLALLCWWPLFFRFVLTWVWKKRPFIVKLLSTTWISAACAGLIFSIGLLDMYYYKKYQIGYGLILSAAGTFFIMLGGIKNERSS